MSSPIERWAANPVGEPHPEFFTHEGRRFVDAVVKLDGTDPGLIVHEARLSLDTARGLHAWLGLVLYDGDALLEKVRHYLRGPSLNFTVTREDLTTLAALAAGHVQSISRGIAMGQQNTDAALLTRAFDAEAHVFELKGQIDAVVQRAEAAEADLRLVDAVLERRTALDGVNKRADKVALACNLAGDLARANRERDAANTERDRMADRWAKAEKAHGTAEEARAALARSVDLLQKDLAALEAAHRHRGEALKRMRSGRPVTTTSEVAVLAKHGRTVFVQARGTYEDAWAAAVRAILAAYRTLPGDQDAPTDFFRGATDVKRWAERLDEHHRLDAATYATSGIGIAAEQARKEREGFLADFHPAARALLYNHAARMAYEGRWPVARHLFVNGFMALVDVVEAAERSGADPWSVLAGPLLDLCRQYTQAVDDLAGYRAREAPVRMVHRAEGLAPSDEVAGVHETLLRGPAPAWGPGRPGDPRAVYHDKQTTAAPTFQRWFYGPTHLHARTLPHGYVVGPRGPEDRLLTVRAWAQDAELATEIMRAHNGPNAVGTGGVVAWRELHNKRVLYRWSGGQETREGWVRQVTARGHVCLGDAASVRWFDPAQPGAPVVVEVLGS